MGKMDTYTKDYMEDNAVFADVFNHFIYQGRQVIRPDNLSAMDTTAITVPYGIDGDAVPIQKYRDKMKLFAVKGDATAVYLLLGVENQSELHYAMPVKNMVYDAMEYAAQVEKIAKAHRMAKHRKIRDITSGEFLTGFYKEDRLIPVITLVIYFGADKWNAPRYLHQMLDIPNERILSYIPDYKINLLVPSEMSDEEIGKFQTDMREVMYFIKYSKDKEKLSELINHNPAYQKMERKAVRVMEAVSKIKIQESEESEEKVNVCEAIQGMIDDAVAEERKKSEQACKAIQEKMDDAVAEERKKSEEKYKEMQEKMDDAVAEERKKSEQACKAIQEKMDDAVAEEKKKSEEKYKEMQEKIGEAEARCRELEKKLAALTK